MLTVLYNGVCGGGWGRLRLLANVRRYLSPCPRHIRVGAEIFFNIWVNFDFIFNVIRNNIKSFFIASIVLCRM
jgi:hypothetical protein